MDGRARERALWLLARGLVTPSEAAALSGTSRQLVHAWCAAAAIDWRARRQAWLLEQYQKAGTRVAKRPTKARLHELADEAKTDWDLRHEHPEADEGVPWTE